MEQSRFPPATRFHMLRWDMNSFLFLLFATENTFQEIYEHGVYPLTGAARGLVVAGTRFSNMSLRPRGPYALLGHLPD